MKTAFYRHILAAPYTHACYFSEKDTSEAFHLEIK